MSSPPSLISTPRPAMLVAMVTEPNAPARAMIWDSSSCFLAFNTWWGTPPWMVAITLFSCEASRSRILIKRLIISGSSGLMDGNPACRAIGRISAMFSSPSGRLRNWSSDTSSSIVLLNFSSHASRMIITCASLRMASAFSRCERRSECSTDVVPTSWGLPRE